MISLLSRIFIKDAENYGDEKVRGKYGVLCAVFGICLNVFLFAFKLLAGTLSGSIAITADAFNNLSDAGSSIITLLGFRLASQKPDSDHPFGHGRFEYISGLVVSMIIVIMGVELVRSSAQKIMNPTEETTFSLLSAAILVVSICVKLYMAFYNRSVGKKINSAAMFATSADSLSDSVATSVVLVGMIVSRLAHINIDGYLGLAVALFIIYAGIGAARDTIDPLLGQPPSEEFVNKINDIVMQHKAVIGIHDLVVHDYGPGRVMISLHAEVSDKSDLLETHDLIDNIERDLSRELGCAAVIHMDPVASDDEETYEMRKSVALAMKEIDGDVTIHDFRMVKGQTHTNFIFDICVPYGVKKSDDEIKSQACGLVKERIGQSFNSVIVVDRDMTGK